jgi:hypothetical protein
MAAASAPSAASAESSGQIANQPLFTPISRKKRSDSSGCDRSVANASPRMRPVATGRASASRPAAIHRGSFFTSQKSAAPIVTHTAAHPASAIGNDAPRGTPSGVRPQSGWSQSV